MNKLALYNVLSLTGFIALAFVIIKMFVPNLNLKILFLGLFASWLILMVGVQIVHFKFKEGQFINRFLMATVFQILAFLGLAVYMIFSNIQASPNILLSVVFTHMAGLFIQTIFFLKQSQKSV
ncbi:hypothetical protein N8079_00545 [Crocinitomicaceae bacterium]|nr:hypothetical protein [Crocinitomicaceae bacterium]MDG1347025.1 hypothetical protein [Crocinitomicaceae bacterium]MDG2464987.1 hypothetical protein [Crocinitomicaceae bacterium]